MRKRHQWFWIPVIMGLLGLAAVPLVAESEGEKEMTAEVVAVDLENGRLTVKQLDAEIHEFATEERAAEKSGVKGKKMTLVVDSETSITEKGGRIVSLADLSPGEQVNVTYIVKDDDESLAVGVDRSTR